MRTQVNGIELAYTDEGWGPTLLFIHGFPFHRAVWSPQVEAFRRRNRVLVPDLRGFGESDATGGTVSMEGFADDIHALIQRLGVHQVVLVGHSMGGYVALAFAHQYPGALAGLVLVGTRAGADAENVAEDRRALAGRVSANGIEEVVAAMAPKMIAPRNEGAVLGAEVYELMSVSGRTGVAAALRGMAERPDATPWLGDIRVPTLVITGEDDAIMPPKESEKLAAAIPGALLRGIPVAGHLVAYEQAEVFNGILKLWLDRMGPQVDAPSAVSHGAANQL